MISHHDFFTQHGRMSNPGQYGHLFANLPTSIPDLVRVVQGMTIHVFWAERYGLKLSADRRPRSSCGRWNHA